MSIIEFLILCARATPKPDVFNWSNFCTTTVIFVFCCWWYAVRPQNVPASNKNQFFFSDDIYLFVDVQLYLCFFSLFLFLFYWLRLPPFGCSMEKKCYKFFKYSRIAQQIILISHIRPSISANVPLSHFYYCFVNSKKILNFNLKSKLIASNSSTSSN